MNPDMKCGVSRALSTLIAEAPRASTHPHIRFRMWCSVTGKPFEVLAELQQDTLRLLRNVTPAVSAAGGTAALSQAIQNNFRIVDAGWPGCPHCGAKHNSRKSIRLLWACSKTRCRNALHCVGDRGGMFRCACGILEDQEFEIVPAIEVRGAKYSGYAAISNNLPNRTQLPRVGAIARLTHRGK